MTKPRSNRSMPWLLAGWQPIRANRAPRLSDRDEDRDQDDGDDPDGEGDQGELEEPGSPRRCEAGAAGGPCVAGGAERTTAVSGGRGLLVAGGDGRLGVAELRRETASRLSESSTSRRRRSSSSSSGGRRAEAAGGLGLGAEDRVDARRGRSTGPGRLAARRSSGSGRSGFLLMSLRTIAANADGDAAGDAAPAARGPPSAA